MTAMVRVAVALVLGLVAAFASTATQRVAAARGKDHRTVGTLWVNAIRMIVVPLVVALLVVGIASSDRYATESADWDCARSRCSIHSWPPWRSSLPSWPHAVCRFTTGPHARSGVACDCGTR